MNYFDKEERIIEWFQTTVNTNEVCFPLKSDEAIHIFESIHNENIWSEWENSSNKNAPPPDFYSDKYRLMMDVMRVDDHTRMDESNRLINPTNQRESQIQRELKESGFLKQFPNVESVFVNAITDLPTLEDHNYQFYYSNFKRIIEKHIKKIPLYKQNHPGYGLVFFVFDESSPYVQVEDQTLLKRGIKKGEEFLCMTYWHFLDKKMVDVFRNSDIDFLIWFSPFKHFESTCPHELPKVFVFDVKKYDYRDVIDYPEKKIISTEE